MDRLWAPWRAKYIKEVANKSPDKCFLCESLKLENPEEAYVLKISKHSFAILNIYPYNTGHVMVVPKKHTGNFEDLTEEEHADLCVLMADCIKAIKLVYQPHGLNIGMNIGRAAGAGLETHLHYHIVPRWRGDTNFMPIIADTKVVSESLDDTFKKLKKALKDLENEK